MEEDFAEILGMHAGDGTIYKTSWSLVWELRGGLDEKEFYDKHISLLLKKVTNITFSPKRRTGGKNGCYGIRTCNKIFIKNILNEGFPIGKKTKTVEIPKSILQGNEKLKSAFLRGLFATDGCAYIAKRKIRPYKYPIIELTSTSFKLVEQAQYLLNELEIKNYCWNYQPKIGGQARFLRISGITRCEKFMDKIGLSNPKHMKKMQNIGNL